MSRSIHHTRKMLIETSKYDYSDDSRRRAEGQRIWDNINKKRRIKKGVAEERRREKEPLPETSPNAVPIGVKDEGPFIHYPATPQDILSVMRRLPPGACDGLKCIELYLGREVMEELGKEDDDGRFTGLNFVCDPFVGRLSHEYLPGIYRPRSLGVYHRDDASIQIAAYVYDPKVRHCEFWGVLLKCHMLSTLVHEIAHHCDATQRVARGRWRMDNREKGETYAEELQKEWVDRSVVPYVQEAYPEQVQALLNWIETQAGVPVTLLQIMGQWEKAEDGNAMLHDPLGLEDFAFAIDAGRDSAAVRLCFAEALYQADYLALTLELAEKILAEQPEHLQALRLKACTLGSMKQHDAAKELAMRAIALDPTQYRTWDVVTKSCARLRQWEEAIKAAEESIRLRIEAGQELHPESLIIRSVARGKLGDQDGLRADIEQLKQRPEPWAKHIIRLIENDLDKIVKQAEAPVRGESGTGV